MLSLSEMWVKLQNYAQTYARICIILLHNNHCLNVGYIIQPHSFSKWPKLWFNKNMWPLGTAIMASPGREKAPLWFRNVVASGHNKLWPPSAVKYRTSLRRWSLNLWRENLIVAFSHNKLHWPPPIRKSLWLLTTNDWRSYYMNHRHVS